MKSSRRGVALRVVAEFLVITAGVLAALAADEWRQTRTEAAQSARYLSELARDLEADTAGWRFAVWYLGEKVDALDRAYAWVRDPAYDAEAVRAFLEDLTTGARAAYDAGTEARGTTFDELVGTGRFELVPAELRRAILEYHEEVELQRIRVTARETGYAPRVYALIPQDPEFTIQQDLTPAELLRIARRARAADLEGVIVAERNRGRLRREVASELYRRAAALLERLQAVQAG